MNYVSREVVRPFSLPFLFQVIVFIISALAVPPHTCVRSWPLCLQFSREDGRVWLKVSRSLPLASVLSHGQKRRIQPDSLSVLSTPAREPATVLISSGLSRVLLGLHSAALATSTLPRYQCEPRGDGEVWNPVGSCSTVALRYWESSSDTSGTTGSCTVSMFTTPTVLCPISCLEQMPVTLGA